MRNALFKFIVAAGLLASMTAHAQSYQFTQFFNSFQFLNPSYTGITGHQYRYGMISRWQWMGVSDAAFTPYQTRAAFGSFMFRHPMSKGVLNPSKSNKGPFLTGGLGVLQNVQGKNAFTTSSATATFAVLVQLAPKAYISAGGDMTLHNAKVNDYILVNDYLNGSNFVTPGESITYPNFSIGLTLVLDKLWLGAALKDVANTPEGATFITQTKKFNDFINIHGGYGHPVGDYGTLKFSTSYKQWREVKQFEAAVGLAQNFSNGGSLNVSLGYRGLPETKSGLANRDAYTAMVGYNNIKILKQDNQAHRNLGNLSVMVSSDLFSPQFGSALRTWEISLFINSPYSKWDRKNCYDYSHGPMAEQITQNLYGGQSPYAPPGARKEIGKDPKKKKSSIPTKNWNKNGNGMKRNQPGIWKRRY